MPCRWPSTKTALGETLRPHRPGRGEPSPRERLQQAWDQVGTLGRRRWLIECLTPSERRVVMGIFVSLSELSDMFQNYLSLVSVINGCIGNGKRNPRISAMPA